MNKRLRGHTDSHRLTITAMSDLEEQKGRWLASGDDLSKLPHFSILQHNTKNYPVPTKIKSIKMVSL